MNNNFNINESLGFLISITNASIRTFFNRAIKKNGIEATAEQWGILNIVKESPGIIQNDIAGKSMKDKTNVTRILDLLEKNNISSAETIRVIADYTGYILPKREILY